MKSIAVLSAVASIAVAQSLTPAGVKTECSTFLKALDTDSAVQDCLKPLAAATAAYTPGKSSSASLSAVKSSLQTVCSSKTCTDQTLGGKLAEFWSASADLTASPKNDDLLRTYDILYTLAPFTAAICTKDESGDFCATKVAPVPTAKAAAGVNNAASEGTSSVLSPANVGQYLASTPASEKRAVALIANTTTFRDSNLPFLFLSPDLASDALCTTCAKNIITSYTTFELAVPYGPGLAASSFLKGRQAIWTAMKSKCSETFVSGGNGAQAVGAANQGILGSGTENIVVPTVALVAGVFAAAVAMM